MGISWWFVFRVFFKAKEAKRKEEYMEELLLDDNSTNTKEGIPMELFYFYKKLFGVEWDFVTYQGEVKHLLN